MGFEPHSCEFIHQKKADSSLRISTEIFGSTRLFPLVYLHTLFSGLVDIKSIKIDNKFPITLTHGNKDNFGCSKYDQNILIFLSLDLHRIAKCEDGAW